MTDSDITRLQRFHAVAQVANATGDRSPVTFKAYRPAPDTGLTNFLLHQSRQKYGRNVGAVRQEIADRRRATKEPKAKAETTTTFGEMPYEDN